MSHRIKVKKVKNHLIGFAGTNILPTPHADDRLQHVSNDSYFIPEALLPGVAMENKRSIKSWTVEEATRWFIRQLNDQNVSIYDWIVDLQQSSIILKAVFSIHLNRKQFYNLSSNLIKYIYCDSQKGKYDPIPEMMFFQFWQSHIIDPNAYEQVIDAHHPIFYTRQPTSLFTEYINKLIIKILGTIPHKVKEEHMINTHLENIVNGLIQFLTENNTQISINDFHNYRTKFKSININKSIRIQRIMVSLHQFIELQMKIQQPDYAASIQYVANLSVEEKDILFLYTRGSSSFQDSSHTNPVNDLERALLEHVFVNAPRLTKPLKLWRGVDLNRIKNYTTIRDIFISTTFDPAIALGFIANGCCLLHITFPVGFPLLCIDEVSYFHGAEKEILGPKPTHLLDNNFRYQIRTDKFESSPINVFEYTAFEDRISDDAISEEANNARFLIDQFTDDQITERIKSNDKYLTSEVEPIVKKWKVFDEDDLKESRQMYFMDVIKELRSVYIKVWGYDLTIPIPKINDRMKRLFWHFLVLSENYIISKREKKPKLYQAYKSLQIPTNISKLESELDQAMNENNNDDPAQPLRFRFDV